MLMGKCSVVKPPDLGCSMKIKGEVSGICSAEEEAGGMSTSGSYTIGVWPSPVVDAMGGLPSQSGLKICISFVCFAFCSFL
jgi:hypothetical protein